MSPTSAETAAPIEARAEEPTETGSRELSPAAQRALTEAAARRTAIDAKAAAASRTPEHHGRGGLEPVRYDDWEIDGRAVDF